MGACTRQAPAPAPPTAQDLYLAGRFAEALKTAPPELAARIHYDDNGPSLNDSLPRGPLSPMAELERKCQVIRCDAAGILSYVQQHKADLPTLIRGGRLLLTVDANAAGDCVEAALPLAQPLRMRNDIVSLHWVAATDELYADVLARNRHHGHARGLYSKALTAYRLWPAQSAYTERRQRELSSKVAALDRVLFQK